MAWLGDAFGDGLSSLKGQITKITKEVLSEDPLAATSFEGRIKELEDEVKKKDSEIEKLRNDITKLGQSKSFELSDYQIQNICELENQISELRNDKDALTKALEEIDVEHNKQLEIVIKDRDSLREKLAKSDLKHETSSVDTEDLVKSLQELRLQNDLLVEEVKSKDQENKQSLTKVAKLKQLVATLKANLEKKNQALEAKTNDDDSNAKYEELQANVQALNELLVTKDAELESLKETNQNQKHLLTEVQLDLEKKIEIGNVMKSSLEVALSDKSETLVQLDVISNQLEKERRYKLNSDEILKKSQLAMEEVKYENEKLLDENKKLKEQLEDTIAKLHNGELFECQLSELKNANEKAMNNIEKLTADNLKLVEQNKNERTELLETLKCKDEIITSQQGNLQELEERLLETETLLQNFMVEQDASNEIKDSLAAITLENEKLRERVVGLEKNASVAVDQSELEQRVIEDEKIIAALEKEKECFEKEKESLMETLEHTKSQLEEVTQTANESVLLEKLASAELVSVELAREKEKVELKLKSALERIEVATRKSEESLQALEADKIELEAEIKDLKEKLNKSNAEMQTRENLVLEDENRIAALENEKKELMETLEHTQSQLEEVSKAANESVFLEKLAAAELVSVELAREKEKVELKLKSALESLKSMEATDEADKIELEAEIKDLKEKLNKSNAIIAETQERENLVSGTLSLEIGKLKAMVNKIRRDFLGPSSDVNGSENDDEASGEEVLHQSQTDDAKRLQQDVYQMMEAIKLIDKGLSSLSQEKTRIEQELTILQSVATKTQQDLSTTMKAKLVLENNIQEWAAALANRDEINRNLQQSKESIENELKILNVEKEKILQSNTELSETIKMMEMDKGILQEKLDETERAAGEWKQRLEELQIIYEHDSKRAEELCSKKDKKITELLQNQGSEGLPEITVEDGETAVPKQVPSENLQELQDQVDRLVEENVDLKKLIKQLRGNIFAMNSRGPEANNEHLHQHRRSHSQVEEPKADLQIEMSKYQSLLAEHQALIEKESNLRKEVERLRVHLVEVEQEAEDTAMANEVQLTEYRTKLAEAEEQLRSSTNVYKSANVRSSQHVEALQTQIQLITVQRNDLQSKLSFAEDNAQKQSAALASLQMVLEQFQVDKQRELKAAEERQFHLIDLEKRRQKELEQEIQNLKHQLAEAKNGLKAALRLSEQLDKKSQIIEELEENLKKTRSELLEKEKKLANINLATTGKIDKSLVKNLVIGYLSAQGDHKTQALKILTSVLELSAEEQTKVGLTGHGGWLNLLLHPSGQQTGPSESLSQAFVRFLETESRPQPQLKLLADAQPNPSKRPTLTTADLMLPTVTPTHLTDTSLKDVLNDS